MVQNKVNEEEAGTKDKLKYSDTWLLLIRRATLMASEGQWLQYMNTVHALHLSLFDEERNKVTEVEDIMINDHPEIDNVRRHEELLIHIIGLLREKKYLTAETSFTYGGGDEVKEARDEIMEHTTDESEPDIPDEPVERPISYGGGDKGKLEPL